MKLFKTVHPSYLVSSSMTWLLIAFVFSSAGATGIQQLAPTADDAPVMLETGRPGFNVFAEFADSAGVIRELDNRLVISIGGSGNETIYFGLSEEYKPNGRPYSANQNTAAAYYFQVRRILPGGLIGEVVHGPFEITRANANVSNYAEAAYPVYSTAAQGPVVGSNDPTLRDIYVFTPDGPGDYSIEFTDRPDPVGNDDEEQVNIPFWDFTVVREGETEPRLGRLWSRSWALRTPQQASPPGSLPYCEWDREFNGRFYSYTEDGFVSLIDFDEAGFRGLSFTVAFNSTGPGVGDNLAEQRMSVAGENVTEDAGQHRIFLEEPDIELFPNGICGMATAGTNFTCSDEGEYCIEVEVTRPGQVEIILDFDNNNVADDSLDVILVYEFSMNDLSTCIPWDLRRGDGSDASLTDSVNIILRYAQGVQHYSAYDVEFLENGFCVNTIRPLCSEGPDPTESFLYWDDRNIPGSPGTVNTPKDGRGGSNCKTDPRTWDRFNTNSTTCRNIVDSLTTGYGDKNTLNTWWFASSSSQFVARVATNTAVIAGDMTICGDATATLTAADPTLNGPFSYNWSGPGISSQTGASIVVSEEGLYRVTVTADNGCRSFGRTTVTTIDGNADQFADNLSICFGDTTQLTDTPNPNLQYTWSPATGISDVNAPNPFFFPTQSTVYTVTIRDAAGGVECESTEQVAVDVSDDLNLQVTGGGAICDPTTTITAVTDVPATIVLFGPDGTEQATGTEFTIDVSGESDYTLVATSADNCTDTVVFSVSGGPVDIAVQDTILACGTDELDLAVTNLDPNDNLSYTWAPAELFDPATVNAANPTFIGAPGDYLVSVTVANQYNCEDTEEIRVILLEENGTLSYTAAPDCDGATVNFTKVGTASFGYIYDFGDGTTSTEENPVHIYEEPGVYTVTLSLIYADGQSCIEAFSSQITVLDAVLEAGFGVTQGECDNGTTSLSFTDATFNATGTALTYAWVFTGATPATSDEESPTVNVTESGTVTASLIVTSADDCQARLDTSITVNLERVDLEDEVTICPGETTALNPGADETLTYTWSPAPDFDANDPNPVTGTPGTYSVTVTGEAADLTCPGTDVITVIQADEIGLVINGPDGPLTGPDGGNGGDGGDGNGGNGGGAGELMLPTQTTCGEPVDLSVELATASNADIVYTNLAGDTLGTGTNLTVSPDGRDTIVVTATDAFGCMERDTVVLINNQVNAGIDVGANGLNFCSATDTSVAVVNFNPSDELSYVWEPNDIISGGLDGASVDITSPEEGSVDLMVTVTNQFGCDTMITVTVMATPFTPNQYESTVQPCFQDAFTINGGPAVEGYTYAWTPADNLDLTDPANPVGSFTEDGDLMVTITDPATGCSESQTIGVDVGPEIDFMVAPADTALCAPGMVSVTGSSVNPAAEITWFADADLTDQVGTGETYTIDAAEIGQTYTVFGQAIDPATGCDQVMPVTVTVSSLSGGLPLGSVVACPGESPMIFGDGGPTSGLVYTYDPADVIDVSDPDAPVFTGAASTTVNVTITDPITGCSSEETIEATVVDLDGLTGTADPETIILGGSSTLTVAGCDACTYEWLPPPNGTISTTTGPSVEVTPDMAGDLVYEVEVTQNGCPRIVTIMLRVEDPICDTENIYVPNAFSPNGDNMNDVMRVRSRFAEELTDFRFIIYDRWGQEVYESEDIFESWDGTVEGDDLEPDVYGYWLRVTCPAGQELVQQGNISLLR